MKQLQKAIGKWVAALVLGLVTLLLGGCGTTGGEIYKEFGETNSGLIFRPGDLITIQFSGVDLVTLAPFTDRIKEDGTITLMFIGTVTSAGKTPGQLQKEIHDKYVPQYFQQLNVTVVAPARYYHVDGDVRGPGPKEYTGQATIVTAIAAAGGFNEFAKKTKVRLTRANGHTQIVNVEKAITNPEEDIPVYPGDKIFVPRRSL